MDKSNGPESIQRLLELSWKPAKIKLQTGALIVAYFIVLIFRAIAPSAPEAGVWAGIINYIGLILAYFVVLFAMTAVAKITLAELRGEKEVPGKAAMAAAAAKLKEIVASPLKIFAIIAGLFIFHGVIDLCGKIPFIGELGWMLSPFVTLPLGIAIVATILILGFGAMFLPTIIIMGKEGPVSELIDFLRKNTIKFVGHFLISLVVAVVTFVILLFAIQLSQGISRTVMGDKYAYIQNHVPGYLQHVPGFNTVDELRANFSIQPLVSMSAKADRWSLYVAGFVFGVIMWLIHMSIWGFIIVNFGVAGTLSYAGLTGAEEKKAGEEEAPPKPKKRRTKKAPPKKKPEKKEEAPEEPAGEPEEKSEES